MAEQARKFGARVAELREKRGWKQRDLVAAMAKLGDQSINTNQLSRYENGGTMPNEQRQEWFATALQTDIVDLMAGPLAERKPAKQGGNFGDVSIDEAFEPAATVEELSIQIEAARIELLARIDLARDEQADLRPLLQPGERGEEGTGT